MLADETTRSRRPKWTWQDRMIVRAFTLYQSSLCSGCAQSRERSFNPHMGGKYQVHPHTCYGCSALERMRKTQKDTAGIKNFVVDAGPPELPAHDVALRPIDSDLYEELMGGATD